jgi:two-component system sensor histidine kinase YesM
MLIIPLVAFSYYFLTTYITRIEDEALSLTKKVNEQSMWSVESYVNQLKSISILPLYDYEALDVLRDNLSGTDNVNWQLTNFDHFTGVAVPATKTNYFDTGEQEILSGLINKIMAMNRNIYSVFIVSPNGDYVYRLIDNSLISNDKYVYNPINESWYTYSLKNKGEAVIGDTKRFDQYVESRGDTIYTFTVSRAINDIFGGKNIGTICIGTNIQYIRNIIKELNPLQGERILITNFSGTIIYDNEEGNISKKITDKDYDLIDINSLDLKKNINEININKKNYLVMSVKSKSLGWNIIRVIPKDTFFKNSTKLRNEFLFLICIIAIITLIITAYITKGITNPLRKLVNTMNLVEQGDLSVRFTAKYSDEVGILGNSFNSMINEIDTLVNTVHVTQLRKRETELSALQAQINPHFIYNTLESIRRMAELNDDIDTAKMTFLLGKMMRYSINIKNKIVTVENEIEHVNNYFDLQNFRFGNRFKIIWDIPEDFYNISIIKLIFQPIVENALYHGLETFKGEGVVCISGFSENNCVCFTISDNGVGINEQKLEMLNEKINDFSSVQQDSESIGLRNINERIKLYYGSDYGLKIQSSFGNGTTVLLVLPNENKLNSIN